MQREWHFDGLIQYADGHYEAVYFNNIDDDVSFTDATLVQIECDNCVCQYCGERGGHKDGCSEPITDLNPIFGRGQ